MKTIEQANSTLAEIAARRAGLIQKRDEMAARMASTERSAGARYLAGDAGAARELTEFRVEVDLIGRALAVLDNHERAGQVDMKRATAADKRLRASQMRTELEALRKKTGKYLAELSKLEGVEYGQSILCAQRTGGWFKQFGGLTPAADFLAPHEVFPEVTGPNAGTIALPKSYKLRIEAEKLDAEAAVLEAELAASEPVTTELPDAA